MTILTPQEIDDAAREMLRVLAGISKTRINERWINTTWDSISETSRDEYRRCVMAVAESFDKAGLFEDRK